MQPVFLLKNVPEQWAVMSLAPQDSALRASLLFMVNE